jgi:DNA primase
LGDRLGQHYPVLEGEKMERSKKIYNDVYKYMIIAHMEIEGTNIEKGDIIGAIFGQTEGLLDKDLDLKNLIHSGKISRIEPDMNLEYHGGITRILLKIQSGLSLEETAVIAATLEQVEKVGPYKAKLKIDKIENKRKLKLDQIRSRAEELYNDALKTEIPDTKEIIDRLQENKLNIINLENGLKAIKGYENYNEIIIVEGEADLKNLARVNIRNVVSINGINRNIPESFKELAKKKIITVFIDGDRGGDMVLKVIEEQGIMWHFVVKAPENLEVEKLHKREILEILNNKIPRDVYYSQMDPSQGQELKKKLNQSKEQEK